MDSNAPEVFAMRREPWQMFVTLTFSNQAIHQAARLSPFFSWVRAISKAKGVHFETVLWILRVERGERHGRIHYHAVLSGLPSQEVNPASCGFFKGLWKDALKMGKPDVRMWDGRDAVSYVCKGDLESLDWNAGANRYESAKFDGTICQVIFANSFKAKYGLDSRVSSDANKRTKLLPTASL